MLSIIWILNTSEKKNVQIFFLNSQVAVYQIFQDLLLRKNFINIRRVKNLKNLKFKMFINSSKRAIIFLK